MDVKLEKLNVDVFPQLLDFNIKHFKPFHEETGHGCPECGRVYKLKSSLRNHRKWECGKEPQFKCPYCIYQAKQKMHLVRHLDRLHKEIDYTVLTELDIVLETDEEK